MRWRSLRQATDRARIEVSLLCQPLHRRRLLSIRVLSHVGDVLLDEILGVAGVQMSCLWPHFCDAWTLLCRADTLTAQIEALLLEPVRFS